MANTDFIQVGYGALNAGSDALRNAITALRQEKETLMQASKKVTATWHPETATYQAYFGAASDIDVRLSQLEVIQGQHAGVLDNHVLDTQALERQLSATFGDGVTT